MSPLQPIRKRPLTFVFVFVFVSFPSLVYWELEREFSLSRASPTLGKLDLIILHWRCVILQLKPWPQLSLGCAFDFGVWPPFSYQAQIPGSDNRTTVVCYFFTKYLILQN